MKFLFAVFLIAGTITFFAKYEVHAQNLSYYFTVETGKAAYEFQFHNGKQFRAALEEETADAVKVNMDGAVMTFSKAEIKEMKPASGGNFLFDFFENAQKQSKTHPLVTARKKNAIMESFDNFIEEPGRLAEDMKKKNPWISQTETLQRQQAADAQARLNAYKARQEKAAAEAVQY